MATFILRAGSILSSNSQQETKLAFCSIFYIVKLTLCYVFIHLSGYITLIVESYSQVIE